MSIEKIEYQRYPSKNRKFIGNDTLWIGQDHILLVESSGISERYKRFFFKDIQAIHILKSKMTVFKDMVFIFLFFLTGLCALTVYFRKPDAIPLTAALLLACGVIVFFLIRSFVNGPACSCWIYSSVQKEMITPINRLKAAKKFLDFIVPKIESIQGKTDDDISEEQKEPFRIKSSTILKNAGQQQPEKISDVWHKTAFFLLLATGIVLLLNLIYRSPALNILFNFVLMIGFVSCVIALARQFGTTLPGTVKNIIILSVTVLVFIGFTGYVEIMFFMVKNAEKMVELSHNTWELIKFYSQINPFEYPLILGKDIFAVVSCLLLGTLGLFSIKKAGV